MADDDKKTEAPAVVEHASIAKTTDEHATEVKAKRKEKPKMVSVLSMFRFATKLDCLMMFVGGMCGIANGAAMAGFSIILGDIYDVLNSGDSDRATSIALFFVWIALGTFVAAGLQVGLWTASSERMTIKLRQRFLDSLLSQDVSFFDRQDAGTITSRVAENSIMFREALGEKFAAMFQFFSMFFGGLIVSFKPEVFFLKEDATFLTTSGLGWVSLSVATLPRDFGALTLDWILWLLYVKSFERHCGRPARIICFCRRNR
jgi:ABC-type bacteriocin/lantibiotic exporter with double-glycine peptidase domain